MKELQKRYDWALKNGLQVSLKSDIVTVKADSNTYKFKEKLSYRKFRYDRYKNEYYWYEGVNQELVTSRYTDNRTHYY